MSYKRKHSDENYDSDPVVSLQDIIEEDKELENTANAVLGASNDQDCTFPDGYMTRQALYACYTCKTTYDAGVCLACSLECHDGHELFELYTKRNFRCDCGNEKFPDMKCVLFPNKDDVNLKNHYNHNFKGSYCTCKRPYPDPDDSIDDEMIQCIICEDWLHSRHLHGKGVPEGSDFAEMICHQCMANKTQFLWYYNWEYTPYQSAVVDVVESTIESETPNNIKAETVTSTMKDNSTHGIESTACKNGDDNEIATNQTTEHIITTDSSCRKNDESDVKTEITTTEVESEKKTAVVKSVPESSSDLKNVNFNKKVTSKMSCKLDQLKETYKLCAFPDSAAFWSDGWRDELCVCNICKTLHMKELLYLTNTSDTVADYERKGEAENTDSTMDQGMRALGGMNRIQQVEVIQGYNDMKSKLSEYLKTFAQEGKVVTEEDIRNFFQGMSESKRQKVNIPYSCK